MRHLLDLQDIDDQTRKMLSSLPIEEFAGFLTLVFNAGQTHTFFTAWLPEDHRIFASFTRGYLTSANLPRQSVPYRTYDACLYHYCASPAFLLYST